MKKWCIAATLLMLLSGCGQEPETVPPAQAQAEQTTVPPAAKDHNPTTEGPGRIPKRELEFLVEGETETVSATLYMGQGYSMYIPDKGWKLDKDIDDGIFGETWESTINEEVELTVLRYPTYPDAATAQIRTAFAADSGYVFEDLMGGEFGDPLTGIDDDGDVLRFMSAESNGIIYLIAWKYPAEAEEGFGARLEQIAETFAVME